MSDTATMVFDSFGRSPHLRIRSAADLEHVLVLDEAHWVATGAPTSALNTDAAFLEYMDIDNNGRIMCYEVRTAVRWLFERMRDRSGIDSAGSVLKLESVNTDTEDGRKIQGSAGKMLKQLGAGDTTQISLDQVRTVKRRIEEKPMSAAGVVLPESADDDGVREFISDILRTVGGAAHSEGRTGVDEKRLDRFIEESRLYLEWHAKGVLPEGVERTGIAPLGADSGPAFDLYAALRGKIDEYFAQSRAAALDRRALDHVKPAEADLVSADMADPQAVEALLKTCPISRPDPKRSLPLTRDINPAYERQLAKLADTLFAPALGRSVESLSEADWATIKRFFAERQAWMDSKAGASVEKLGAARLKQYNAGRYAEAVRKLLDASRKAALVLDNIRLVEKLILYQRHMIDLANNFVGFPHLYDPTARALFETGTLVIDGRLLNFAVKVENRAEHSAVARTSDIFVIYIEVTPTNGPGKYELALPVTSGSKGNLCVGKRGVFCDLAGAMHDAKVVQIIENPISIREAMISPFQRMGKVLTGKIEAMTTAAEKNLDGATAGVVARVEQPGAPGTDAAPQSKGMMAGGLLMGGSVAVAALGSAAAYITNTFRGVASYKIALGVLAAVVAVIAPASLIALMKLRRRDLSAILEGSGWAINARMRLTLKQGRIFTHKPRLPEGSVIAGNIVARGITALCVLVVTAFLVIRIAGCMGRESVEKTAPVPAMQGKAESGSPASQPQP